MQSEKKKTNSMREVWEEDVFDSYLEEMTDLVNRYPADPNTFNFGEEKLLQLIAELDKNWDVFQKRWQQKLKKTEKIFATAAMKKEKSGMRHLIIKTEFSGQAMLDLRVADTNRKKRSSY